LIPPVPVATVPAVTTVAASGVTRTQATLNGSITSDGGYNCTQVNFGYRPQGTSTWQYTTTQYVILIAGAFSATVTGLSPGTAYEFEAQAYNQVGWGEGQIDSFTTADVARWINIYWQTDEKYSWNTVTGPAAKTCTKAAALSAAL